MHAISWTLHVCLDASSERLDRSPTRQVTVRSGGQRVIPQKRPYCRMETHGGGGNPFLPVDNRELVCSEHLGNVRLPESEGQSPGLEVISKGSRVPEVFWDSVWFQALERHAYAWQEGNESLSVRLCGRSGAGVPVHAGAGAAVSAEGVGAVAGSGGYGGRHASWWSAKCSSFSGTRRRHGYAGGANASAGSGRAPVPALRASQWAARWRWVADALRIVAVR